MKRALITLFVFTTLVSCQNNKKFKVEGIVENAQGEIIVLEHAGIAKTIVLDSMKISKEGKYALKAKSPEYSDFYRIRIKNKSIIFVVDSIETIRINANLDNFSTEYTVLNSYQSEQIKELRVSVINIQNKINALKLETEQEERLEKVDEIEKDLEQHKVMVRKFILENPRSSTSYFALYQQINGQYIFSPFIKEDYPYWAAVATAYNTFMPNYDRSRNLYNFVLEALREEQKEKQQAVLNELIENEAKGYIDMSLPDKNGRERKLSELEGKVVLIDFSAYGITESVDYTFSLRDLYTKHNKAGFEIYQISLDRNKLLWDISVDNIPWICVRDENGQNNRYAQLYNVSQLPTTFLMDKEGNIVARDMKFSEMDKEIDKLLKKK